MSTEPLATQYQTQKRRKSVFVEGYNPENADDTENTIYPKSDQQRAQLHEAVKEVLMFRELDADQVGLLNCFKFVFYFWSFCPIFFFQMHQVLDAMFEKTCVADETIITQGDNGDNFYVIAS